MAKKRSSKKPRVLTTGSPQFLDEITAGRTVRVKESDWLAYWQSVGGDRDREIKHLKEVIAGASRDYNQMRLQRDQVETERNQVKEDCLERIRLIRQREKVITALLMPWAVALGPARLQFLLLDLLHAVGLQVDVQTENDIQILISDELRELLKKDKIVGENTNNALHFLLSCTYLFF